MQYLLKNRMKPGKELHAAREPRLARPRPAIFYGATFRGDL